MKLRKVDEIVGQDTRMLIDPYNRWEYQKPINMRELILDAE